VSNDANPTPTRGVPLELDGKTYYLRCSLATRRRLIQEMGGEEGLKKLKGDDVGKVILEFMKDSAPEMTLEKLEDLIDMQNFQDAVDAMAKAMGQKAVGVVGEAQPESAAAPAAGQAD
jgi:hypothetical protein